MVRSGPSPHVAEHQLSYNIRASRGYGEADQHLRWLEVRLLPMARESVARTARAHDEKGADGDRGVGVQAPQLTIAVVQTRIYFYDRLRWIEYLSLRNRTPPRKNRWSVSRRPSLV